MLSKADRSVLSALSTLKGDADFEVFVKYLERSLQDLLMNSRMTKDETYLRWQQGAAQALSQLIETAYTARENLHKIR
jgi:hypothetical protein